MDRNDQWWLGQFVNAAWIWTCDLTSVGSIVNLWYWYVKTLDVWNSFRPAIISYIFTFTISYSEKVHLIRGLHFIQHHNETFTGYWQIYPSELFHSNQSLIGKWANSMHLMFYISNRTYSAAVSQERNAHSSLT